MSQEDVEAMIAADEHEHAERKDAGEWPYGPDPALDAESEEWMNAALGSYPESTTPAIDKVMETQFATETGLAVPELQPEDYQAAALEAYDLLGQVLSETGSMYLLLGSLLTEMTQGSEEDASV